MQFWRVAAEGLTLPAIHALLRPHVYIGFALIPPVALKVGGTLYRLARFHARSPTTSVLAGALPGAWGLEHVGTWAFRA